MNFRWEQWIKNGTEDGYMEVDCLVDCLLSDHDNISPLSRHLNIFPFFSPFKTTVVTKYSFSYKMIQVNFDQLLILFFVLGD